MSTRFSPLPALLALVAALPATVGALPHAGAGAWAAEEVVEVTLTELMSYEWKPGRPVPREIQDLDGKKVRITGLMALGTLEGVTEFELVSDACGCGQSKMNHFVKVELEEGTTGYTPSELTVTGTFEIGEEVEDGFVVSLYRLSAEKLEKK